MIQFKSRVSEMIERLENGETLAPEDMKRTLQLQALDVAKAGEDYVIAYMQEQERRTNEFRELMESPTQ